MEWENAYRYTRKTIEMAARLKAPLVVLHYGCIEMKEYTEKLVEMVARGERETPKYEKLREEVIRKRGAAKERYIERANELIRRLLPQVEELGLKLGIENREAVEELPLGKITGCYSRSWRARRLFTGTTRGMRRSRRISGSWTTRSIWNRSATNYPGFTFMTCNFRDGTIARPGRGRLILPR